MEKRAFLAVILSFLVMIVFWYLVPQPAPTQKPRGATEKAVSPVGEPEARPPAPTPGAAYHPAQLPEAAPAAGAEKLIHLDSQQLRASFSTIGGGLKELEVKTYHDRAGKNIVLSSPENRYFALAIAHLGDEDLRSLPFEVVHQGLTSVEFRATTARGVEVTKKIMLRPTQYLFEVELTLQNKSGQQLNFPDGYDLTVGGVLPVTDGYGGSSALGIDAIIDHDVKRLGFGKVKTERWEIGNIAWASVKNQFCAFILKPDQFAVGLGSWRFPSEKEQGLAAALRSGEFALVPNETKQDRFLFYSGPKEYDTLKSIGHEFDQVMDFGKYLGPFSILILKCLNWIYGWCFNYGIAIIILTAVIKIITLPLTHKSFKSMKEMQAIQPQLGALREKLKDNPKKLQSEMMALYKEHRINPLGGCLPLLLQMPILIAFFKTLNNAVELRGAPFFGWIKDLSAPDQLFMLPFSIPILGNGFNVLPILMLVSFVVQQKMSSAANKGMAVTPQQQQQQKMMMTLMPVLFGVMFYNMPSGLVLYFTVSTVLGLFQQYYVMKKPTKVAVPAA